MSTSRTIDVGHADPRSVVLDAVVRHPGATAAAIGAPYAVAARLRRLREAGLVEARGPAPSRWYPTRAGEREVNQRRLAILRARARHERTQALETIRSAEEVAAFAESIASPSRPMLCAPQGRQSLSFGEFIARLKESVGREVLIATETERAGPKISPIVAVGTIGYVEEERENDIGDWSVIVSMNDVAFVEFSRRQFGWAYEDVMLGELHLRQASQTTMISFEP
jgi:hypothetical protein